MGNSNNIVNTDSNYTYEILQEDISTLSLKFPFLTVNTIGKSVMGKELYSLKLGNGPKEVLLVAATHANEWITTPVLMKFIEDVSNAYIENKDLYNKNARNIFDSTSIYIVPMLNPDGVDLVTGAINTDTSEFRYAKSITGSIPFPSGWKANILGVDLNLNFPAEWEKAKEIKYSKGFTRTFSSRLCWTISFI